MSKGDVFRFYASQLANKISKGGLISRGNLSPLEIKPLFSQILTKEFIKTVICITSVNANYEGMLLKQLQAIAFKVNKKAKVYLNFCGDPQAINISSDDFDRKMKDAYSRYSEYKTAFDSLSEADQMSGKKFRVDGMRFKIDKYQLEDLKEKYGSYKYVYDTCEKGGKFFKVYTFIELLSPDLKTMSRLYKEVTDYLKRNKFIITSLSSNCSYFLTNFGPAGKHHESTTKEFIPNLFSDENLSYLQPFDTDGFIGDGHGQLLGLYAGSKTPFILNFFESGSRQIILLEAPAGEGKTIQGFGMAISFLNSNAHVSVLDVKGDEWCKLNSLLNNIGIIIDFSEDSNTYVNTLRLDDLKVETEEEAKEFYNMSIKSTSQILRIIAKPINDKEKAQCEYISKEVVPRLFQSVGVRADSPKTFVRSRDLLYEHLIPILGEMKHSKSNAPYYEMIDTMITRCNQKFRRSNVFKGREIKLSDVINSPLVIYALDKNKDTTQDDDDIKTFMISYLDWKKFSMRKKMGEFTVAFYEEMSRKEEFQSFIKHINGAVTGARSMNVNIVLLCNSIQTFKDKDIQAVTSNISTAFIGPMVNEEDYKVLDEMNLGEIKGKVKAITNNPKVSKNFFAVKYDTGKQTGTAVCKCILPDDILRRLETREVKSYD